MQLPSFHWVLWDAAQQNLLTGSSARLLSFHQKYRNIPTTLSNQSILTIDLLITRQSTDRSLSLIKAWRKGGCSHGKHIISNLHEVAGSIVTTYFPILSWEAHNLQTGGSFVWPALPLVPGSVTICFMCVIGYEFNQWAKTELSKHAQLNKTGLLHVSH